MAVLTIKHYNDIVDSFVQNVAKTSKSYYMFIGKASPWDDDTNPPAANTSVAEYEQTVYDNMVFGKLITENDIAYLIDRENWTSGTVYDVYDQQDGDLYTKNFHVVNNKYEVYKCLDNNYGGPSTIMPNLNVPRGTFNTSDGYTWKYMYTIDVNANTKFTTTNYIPITLEQEVKDNVVPGTIDIIKVANTGLDYQTTTSGFLTAYVNSYVVQLSGNASPYSDFYKDSSIYLKLGFGSGQIRKIRSSNGHSKQIITYQPFDVYSQFELGNINGAGAIETGLIVTQNLSSISLNYEKGFFNIGDVIVQSGSLASGKIVTSNNTTIKVDVISANAFNLGNVVYSTSQEGIIKNGTVTISSNVYVNAVSGQTFPTDYSIGDYIRVGDVANNNIKRIVAVNTTVVTVDSAFTANLVANVHYRMPYAATASSITLLKANGVVHATNLNGYQLNISNSQISTLSFTVGENINMVDINNISQGANGIVSYANSTTVLIDNVLGTFTSGNYLLGSSSYQKSQIDFVKSNPGITIANPSGGFLTGLPLYFRRPENLSSSVANATLLSSYITPNELTEYVIAPTIEIVGDGSNALAYPIMDPSTNGISSVVMINPGSNYTYANINIVCNTFYGSGAVLAPSISPIHGHGYDLEQELGARHVGISVTFDTISNETYAFPSYGKYRKIGIIENPLFDDISLRLDNFERAKVTLANRGGTNFIDGEVVKQANANGVGIVVYSNSTFMELKNISNEWVYNTDSDNIYGFTSTATANVKAYSQTYFNLVGGHVEVVSELYSGANGVIIEANPAYRDVITLTNVGGRFDANDTVIDSYSNAYANVGAIYTANNTHEITDSFGKKFVQTARITLSSKYGNFQQFEYVTQDVTNAYGIVISTNNEVDIVYLSTDQFSVGDIIYNTNTSAGGTGVVTFANDHYVRLTSVNGSFVDTDVINNGDIVATVANSYQVLVLADVNGSNRFQTGSNNITGAISKAYGVANIAGTILYPNLVRESGSVIYVENVSPFERANTTKEKISLVIKF